MTSRAKTKTRRDQPPVQQRRRRRAERARAETERRLRNLIDNAPFGALEYELRRDGKLILIGCNPSATRILKTDCQQFIGKTLEENFPPLVHTEVPHAFRRAAACGERYDADQLDYEYGGIQGTFEIYGFQTASQKMAVLFRDVRDRKIAEQRLNRFFEISLDLLGITDLEGRFQRLNPRWHHVLGFKHQELVGKSFNDFVHSEDAQETGHVFERLGVQREAISFVNRYRCSNGTYRWMEWNAVPAGGLLYIAGRDLTERIESERRLREAKEAAENADRIKSSFLDIAAHELRTPVAALGLLVETSQLQVKKGIGVQRDVWERLSRQVRRLSRLVNELLDVTRLERGKLELSCQKFELLSAVTESVDLFQHQHPDRSIRMDAELAPIEIFGDPVRIQQVLNHLIENAVRYSPGGSAIEIRVVREQPWIRISVRDHGAGILPQNRSHLFTRFYRLASDANLRHPGLGLGLFISKGLIELHGGKMGFDSKVGEGSCFYFLIPEKDSTECQTTKIEKSW